MMSARRLTLLLLLPWLVHGASAGPGPTRQHAPPGDTVMLQGPACVTELGYRDGQHLLRFRDSCRDGAQASAARLVQLLASLGNNGELAQVLDCGRLLELDPQFSQRLASAARESPVWSEAWRSRETSGAAWANRAVAGLIGSQGIFREFERALAEHGLRLQLRSVEKVLVDEPGSVALQQVFDAGGVSAGLPLPYDAQVWFTLQPIERRDSAD